MDVLCDGALSHPLADAPDAVRGQGSGAADVHVAEQRSDPRHAHQGRVRTHVASDGALGVFGFFCFFGGVELGDVPGLADSGDSYDMGESYSRGMCCFLQLPEANPRGCWFFSGCWRGVATVRLVWESTKVFEEEESRRASRMLMLWRTRPGAKQGKPSQQIVMFSFGKWKH